MRGGLFDLSDDDFELLRFACARHTDGLTQADITVQVCWDSDRLDLGRVGIPPVASKLCTAAAKSREVLQWADQRAIAEFVPDLVVQEWGIVGHAEPQ